MASEVRKTLQDANRTLFGPHYSRHKRVWLATYAVQEMKLQPEHATPTPHTHMLVGVPEGSLSLKVNKPKSTVPDIVQNAWIKRDPFYRRAKAQDAQEIYEFKGAEEYINKTIRYPYNSDSIDVINTTFPNFPATVS